LGSGLRREESRKYQEMGKKKRNGGGERHFGNVKTGKIRHYEKYLNGHHAERISERK